MKSSVREVVARVGEAPGEELTGNSGAGCGLARATHARCDHDAGSPSGAPRLSRSGNASPSPVKSIDTELRQWRCPVGGGPSGKTWPRWLPQRAQTSSSRTMPYWCHARSGYGAGRTAGRSSASRCRNRTWRWSGTTADRTTGRCRRHRACCRGTRRRTPPRCHVPAVRGVLRCRAGLEFAALHVGRWGQVEVDHVRSPVGSPLHRRAPGLE